MHRAWLIATLAVMASSGWLHAQSCESAFTDTLSIRTLSYLDRVAVQAAVWDNFELARHPVLLLADTTYSGKDDRPVCAAIWRAGSPLARFGLHERPRLATPLYGMIDLDSVPSSTLLSAALSRISSADASILRSLGVSKAVFIEVPLAFGRMGELGRMLSLAKADPALIHAELAVHESFHLFAQFPNWFGSPQAYAWPAWDRQPDRRQLRERCYQLTPEMTSALNAEIAELLSAFDVLLGAVVDTAAALTHARQFVALRSGRHAALDTVRITQGDRLIGCREAEDLMEMEEGVPQWLGHATAVRAGLRDRERYRASYAGQQPDAFYRSGPLMLWVLQGLLGESALHDLTARMSRSSSGREGAPYSVFVGAAGR